MTKIAYKTKNGKAYDLALIKRGDIRNFLTPKVLMKWFSEQGSTGGRPQCYSDICIELILTIRYAYGLSLRGAQGLVCSIFEMANINLPVPHYSTVCKRQASLQVKIQRKIKYLRKKTEGVEIPLDLIFDSTGLKGYGEGEWKIKVHDKTKARCWSMLHIAMCPDTFQIMDMDLKSNRSADCKMLPIILGRIKRSSKIGKVYGDKGYTSIACFEAIANCGGQAIIDIQRGVKRRAGTSPGHKQRNNILLEMKSFGRKGWKTRSGYHRRSLVETQMFRWKKILGPSLSSRKSANQKIEARIKAKILNIFASLGMPDTETVAA